MSALTDALFYRSDAWPMLVVGLLFGWMGVTDLAHGDGLNGAARLLLAVGVLTMFGGARLGLRPVQWAGLATLGGGIALQVVELFGLVA